MDSKFFAKNRSNLLKKVSDFAPIIISANGLLQRTRDDEVFPFGQDGNFWYLTGVNEPDVILVIDGSSEYLVLPKRDDRHKVFSEQIDKDKIKDTSGINEIYDYGKGWEKLTGELKKSKSFYTVKPAEEFLSAYDVYSNPAPRRLVKKIFSISSTLEQKDISKEIVSLRTIKSEEEVHCIKRAIKYTGEILDRISKNIGDYKNEHDIAADLNDFYFRNKLDYAFMPIVAGGRNATILHYKSNKNPINKKDLVLIDTGVKFNNYCSDITRTIMKNPTARQKAVYQAVADTQAYAMSLLKPGVLIREYETKVAKFIGSEMKKLGLIKEITNENVRKYYPHGTSHSLGIDVHDPADYSRPLELGMVITVEPGIYIPEENIGVRIEDNVLITQDGIEKLSSSIMS
ncbi:MAG: aminopeptidase P family protein [Candidatus Saccharimonadales bacterium]